MASAITILATVTVTVTETSTPTPTPTPTPSPTPLTEADVGYYIDTYWCCISWVNLAFVMSTILVIFIINDFNRLVAIPLVSSTAACIGNALNWYGWYALFYSDYARRVAVLTANGFFIVQGLALPLYSFFMLEKILSGRKRRVYMTVFVVLYIAVVALRIPGVVIIDRYFTWPEEKGEEVGHLLDQLNQSYYVLIAVMEIWSAYFLLRTFYGARKRSKHLLGASHRAPLFKALARSSEVRVASLATWGIFRLVCFRSNDNAAQILKNLDRFAVTMLNCYPFLLQLDLVSAKMLKLQATVMQHGAPAERGRDVKPQDAAGIEAVHGKGDRTHSASVSPGGRRPAKPTGRKDSLRTDFAFYGMGGTFFRRESASTRKNSMIPPGVSKVSEEPMSKATTLNTAGTTNHEIEEENRDIEKLKH